MRTDPPSPTGQTATPALRPRALSLHPASWPGALRAAVAVAAGAAGGLAVELAGTRPALAGLAGGVGLAALLRWWPGSALLLLLGAAAANRFTYPLGGADIKPEHVAAVLLAGLILARLLLAPPRPVGPRLQLGPGLALAGLALYLGSNLVASYVNAPDPATSLRQVGLITLVAVPYGLALNLVGSRVALRLALLVWLGLGLVEAGAALGTMALWQGWGLDLGVQQVLFAPPVPIGTMREGNLLGSYTAATTVGLLALLLTTHQHRLLLGGSLAGLLMLAGVAISLSRGAWLGLLAGVVLLALVRGGMAVRRGAVVAVVLAICLPAAFALAGSSGPGRVLVGVAERLATLDLAQVSNDRTVLERLDTYQKAREGIAAQPLIGNGTGSFGQRYRYQSVDEPAWVGNLELHLLYDSGLLGFCGFWLVVGAVSWRAVRAYCASRDPLLRAVILGLGGGLLTLLVAYQATEATWLAFTWVHLGLLAGAAALVPPPSRLAAITRDIPQ